MPSNHLTGKVELFVEVDGKLDSWFVISHLW